MGLFDTFKAVGDIIKGGIESYKADSKLDDILAELWTSYEDKLTSADKEAYLNYKMLQEKIEAQNDAISEENKELKGLLMTIFSQSAILVALGVSEEVFKKYLSKHED